MMYCRINKLYDCVEFLIESDIDYAVFDIDGIIISETIEPYVIEPRLIQWINNNAERCIFLTARFESTYMETINDLKNCGIKHAPTILFAENDCMGNSTKGFKLASYAQKAFKSMCSVVFIDNMEHHVDHVA